METPGGGDFLRFLLSDLMTIDGKRGSLQSEVGLEGIHVKRLHHESLGEGKSTRI